MDANIDIVFIFTLKTKAKCIRKAILKGKENFFNRIIDKVLEF